MVNLLLILIYKHRTQQMTPPSSRSSFLALRMTKMIHDRQYITKDPGGTTRQSTNAAQQHMEIRPGNCLATEENLYSFSRIFTSSITRYFVSKQIPQTSH